jgi:hypothetical protein
MPVWAQFIELFVARHLPIEARDATPILLDLLTQQCKSSRTTKISLTYRSVFKETRPKSSEQQKHPFLHPVRMRTSRSEPLPNALGLNWSLLVQTLRKL